MCRRDRAAEGAQALEQRPAMVPAPPPRIRSTPERRLREIAAADDRLAGLGDRIFTCWPPPSQRCTGAPA
jgi:hypothetical protein